MYTDYESWMKIRSLRAAPAGAARRENTTVEERTKHIQRDVHVYVSVGAVLRLLEQFRWEQDGPQGHGDEAGIGEAQAGGQAQGRQPQAGSAQQAGRGSEAKR